MHRIPVGETTYIKGCSSISLTKDKKVWLFILGKFSVISCLILISGTNFFFAK